MDEVGRTQFIQGFKDGYSDPKRPDTGSQWYKLGVQQGKVARSFGMTIGKIKFPDREI
jgi:hypothetical protein